MRKYNNQPIVLIEKGNSIFIFILTIMYMMRLIEASTYIILIYFSKKLFPIILTIKYALSSFSNSPIKVFSEKNEKTIDCIKIIKLTAIKK